MQFLYLIVAIVERVAQMRSRPSGLAATDRAINDHNYRASSTCEHVGGRHSGNAGSNYADASAHIARKLRQLRRVASGHPDRSGAARIASHGLNYGRVIAVGMLWRIPYAIRNSHAVRDLRRNAEC